MSWSKQRILYASLRGGVFVTGVVVIGLHSAFMHRLVGLREGFESPGNSHLTPCITGLTRTCDMMQVCPLIWLSIPVGPLPFELLSLGLCLPNFTGMVLNRFESLFLGPRALLRKRSSQMRRLPGNNL
jgi:hypothetical protein